MTQKSDSKVGAQSAISVLLTVVKYILLRIYFGSSKMK